MTELEDLSPEQQDVVRSWGQGLAVLAGAGSGKTTTLTIKCAELLKRNPEARFAAVSFTERSAGDLRLKLTERLTALREQGLLPAVGAKNGAPAAAGSALAGHWVTTIHGLCQSVIREHPREAGYDGEESMLSEPEAQALWERSLESLWLDETIPPEVIQGVDLLLERESRDSVSQLLKRVRELHSSGILKFLEGAGDPAALALAQVGRYVLDRYDRLKRRRGALDFNDLEAGADRALEHESVREAYHRRFDLVMVDEFQDTNPVQARILKRLVRPDFSNLCVVGDPKQSIYRFRDADVSLFEEFCSTLPLLKTLSWNFRSRPGIIEYANELCAPAFEASALRYDSLVPKRPPGDEAPVVRLDVESPEELARWIRAENARGIPLHDMALLVRKVRGNEKWFKALTAAGIPIAVGSGGLFWSDPRVRECVAMLKWWDNPGNSLSGAIFLRAPWMGIDDGILDQWIKMDPTWQRPFFSADHQKSHSIARALGALRGKIVRPGELLLALLSAEDGEMLEAELGAPILGLWHRVEELSSRGMDFYSVVSELSDCCSEERREREVPPPRNHGQLSILTLHGSKGLEFPHVILIDLGKKGKAPDTPLLFWDRVQGAYLAGRDEDGQRDKKNALEASWRETEKRKNLAESKRIFYVALTRAQERLVLVCPRLEEKADATELLPEVAYAEDHWRAWVECSPARAVRLELGHAAPKDGVEGVLENVLEVEEKHDEPPATTESQELRRAPRPALAPRLLRPRHSVTEWNLLSRCERAYEWTYVRPVSLPPEDGLFVAVKQVSQEERELTSRELGTRVHGCLERADYEGLRELQKQVGVERFSAEPVIEWAQRSHWMQPTNVAKGREVWAELAFEVPFAAEESVTAGSRSVAPEVLVGSLDRLVMDQREDGTPRYTIIDFKITDQPKTAQELIDSYGAQMQLYAEGLRRLDPEVSKPEAVLVNISAGAVVETPVPIGRSSATKIAARAAEIVAGDPGRARPCGLCRYCDFRSHCDVGRRVARR